MRLPLGNNLKSRDGTLAKDALVTNGYTESAGEDKTRTYKRGGLNLVTTLGSSAGQGIINYTNASGTDVLFAVQDGSLVLSDIPPASGAWTTLTGGGTAGHHPHASFGGLIFAVTGQSTLYKSSITSSTWTTTNSNSFGGSSLGAGGILVSYNQALYLVSPNFGAGATKQVWRTTDGATWTQLTTAAAFTADSGAVVLVFNGKMWWLGGRYDSTDGSVYSSSDGITWTLATATPAYYSSTRTIFGACVFNGKMWVMGGDITGTCQKDVYYSSDGATWTQATAAAAWTAVKGPTVIAAGAVMYLLGGMDTGNTNIDQVYSTLDGITWTTVSHSTFYKQLWGDATDLAYMNGFLFNQSLVVFGSDSGVGTSIYPATTATGSATIGAVGTGFFDFAKNLDGTQIMVKGPTSAYKLNTTATTITAISDADYPAQTVRGCVYLDGSFYVMETDGTISESDSENCASWNPVNFLTAEFEPDSGVCLSKFNNYVVAFGQWTTQMFWDAANPTGIALSPVQNGVILIGCASANSVAQIESTILWMAQRKGQGSTFQKGRFIAMMEGTSYIQISTPDVDRVLDADDLATVYSCVGSFGGHNFYILSLGTTGISLVYDMTRKQWFSWTRCKAATAKTVTSITQSLGVATATVTAHGFSDGDPVTIAGANQSGYNLTFVNITYVDANTFTYPVATATVSPATGTITATSVTEGIFDMISSCNYNGQQVFQEASGGSLFSLLDTIYRDNSQPINFKCRTDNQDSDTNKRKFVSIVTPICDLTSAAQTGLVRYTDNDFQTYSTYRRLDISDVTPSANRFGNYRRRAWEWRYTGNTAHRIESLELDMRGEKTGGGGSSKRKGSA